MNKLIIIGNLVRDPEIRTISTSDGATNVCNFFVAVNRPRGEATDYFRVTAWRALGDRCAQYLSKGSKVCIWGPVSYTTYQTQEGETRVSMEITADGVEFCDRRQDGPAR